jgi:predicted glutamine amidotransferase
MCRFLAYTGEPILLDELLYRPHNGQIGGFMFVKRKLINQLSDERYRAIQGTTDTEHAFAIFLYYLVNPAYSPA